MRIHRFFVAENLASAGKGKVRIENDELVHQWRSVLRFQVGQEVILFDGSGGSFQCVILALTNRSAEVQIVAIKPNSFSPKSAVCLFLSLAKRDAFEWALEKGTELGVTTFVPVISERSEKKEIKMERTKTILKESCEQSGRSVLPEIYDPVSLDGALKSLPPEILTNNSFALHPEGEPFALEAVRGCANKNPSGDRRINVFIGPEGGFSPAEIELFKQHNVPIYSLGNQVLRAETATVAISSLLLL